jgi:hypothetical protein
MQKMKPGLVSETKVTSGSAFFPWFESDTATK